MKNTMRPVPDSEQNAKALEVVPPMFNPEALKGNLSIQQYKEIWIAAFPRSMSASKPKYRKSFYKRRLSDLETWDTSNNKPNERQGKILALRELINESENNKR